MLQDAEHVLCFKKIRFYVLQNGENEFVKEFPFVLEELGEEGSSYFCLVFGQDGAEEAEDPIAGVHLGLNVVFFKMGAEFRQMCCHKHVDDVTVLVEPR